MTVYYLDGMKIIAIVRQYCEKNVLDEEKKKSVIWTSIERSNPSGPLRFEFLQLDTLPVESISSHDRSFFSWLSPVYLCLPEQLRGRY